jgi:hypothetical protein
LTFCCIDEIVWAILERLTSMVLCPQAGQHTTLQSGSTGQELHAVCAWGS